MLPTKRAQIKLCYAVQAILQNQRLAQSCVRRHPLAGTCVSVGAFFCLYDVHVKVILKLGYSIPDSLLYSLSIPSHLTLLFRPSSLLSEQEPHV